MTKKILLTVTTSFAVCIVYFSWRKDMSCDSCRQTANEVTAVNHPPTVTTDIWYTGILDKSIREAVVISVNNVIYVAGAFVNGVGSDQVWILEF
jgi:hypothetical protein